MTGLRFSRSMGTQVSAVRSSYPHIFPKFRLHVGEHLDIHPHQDGTDLVPGEAPGDHDSHRSSFLRFLGENFGIGGCDIFLSNPRSFFVCDG